jgi:hypothetical protein
MAYGLKVALYNQTAYAYTSKIYLLLWLEKLSVVIYKEANGRAILERA